MNMSKKTSRLVMSALIAALYVAVTFMQEFIFPGSASMSVQFRISEALTVLCLFTPAAVPGLTVGCFLANFTAMGALPVDIIFGTFATFLACLFMRKLKDMTVKSVPVLSLMMPAIFNGIIIGAEIEIFFIQGPFNFVSFLMQGSLVALGELGVLFTLGLALVKIIKDKKFEKYLNSI